MHTSHITPCNKWWIIQRKIFDTIEICIRKYSKIIRKIIYLIGNRNEANKTNNDIFLVYTMGLVASNSILNSISNRLPHVHTYAMHYLNQKNLLEQENLLKDSLYKKMHTEHATNIKKCISDNPEKKIKIITVIREPISLMISQIFHQQSRYDLSKLMHLTQSTKCLDYNYPASWCHDELKSFSNVDILKLDFDKKKGYSIYQNGNISLLVIKFEDIDFLFSDAMEEFTGIPRWKIGKMKKTPQMSKEYLQFKNSISIDAALLNQIYSSQYVIHFYQKSEIQNFMSQWRNNCQKCRINKF